jgi:hypothetical protein
MNLLGTIVLGPNEFTQPNYIVIYKSLTVGSGR